MPGIVEHDVLTIEHWDVLTWIVIFLWSYTVKTILLDTLSDGSDPDAILRKFWIRPSDKIGSGSWIYLLEGLSVSMYPVFFKIELFFQYLLNKIIFSDHIVFLTKETWLIFIRSGPDTDFLYNRIQIRIRFFFSLLIRIRLNTAQIRNSASRNSRQKKRLSRNDRIWPICCKKDGVVLGV